MNANIFDWRGVRQALRAGVVQSLIPAVNGAAIIAGVADVGQRRADLLHLDGFPQAGQQCLFHFINQDVREALLLSMIDRFMTVEVTRLVRLPMIVSLQHQNDERILAFGRIAGVHIVIQHQRKAAILHVCVERVLIAGFGIIAGFVKDFRIFDAKLANQILEDFFAAHEYRAPER